MTETEIKKPVEKKKPETFPESEAKPEEFGGPKGPEPTRFGDWELKGKCVDF
ncbi:MAG: DUF1674 domain-containing protein [Proteobacteria bacterium]|nr:DUF1674 domain-containing protein [Pseudomonadota bacterium]